MIAAHVEVSERTRFDNSVLDVQAVGLTGYAKIQKDGECVTLCFATADLLEEYIVDLQRLHHIWLQKAVHAPERARNLGKLTDLRHVTNLWACRPRATTRWLPSG